jgi:hypothetical protein
MSGAGLIQGREIDTFVGFRADADDSAYVNHTGATYHPQSDSTSSPTNNVAYYEIQNAGDQIDINLGEVTGPMDEPRVVFYSAWGPTEFDIIDRSDSETVMGDLSGFDSDVWQVSVQITSPELRFTNFANTQAGWYAYCGVFDAIV